MATITSISKFAEGEIGKTYGRLTLLKPIGKSKYGTVWAMKCSCGNECEAVYTQVKRGRKSSCGCLLKENKSGKLNATHGASVKGSKNYKEFTIWSAIKQRCLNPNDKSYSNYGGRGIDMFAGWVDSFEQFLSDMGPMPFDKASIDRIDNNKGYYPLNCRWASKQTQNNNKRSTIYIEFNGEFLPTAIVAKRLNMNPVLIRFHAKKGRTIAQILNKQF